MIYLQNSFHNILHKYCVTKFLSGKVSAMLSIRELSAQFLTGCVTFTGHLTVLCLSSAHRRDEEEAKDEETKEQSFQPLSTLKFYFCFYNIYIVCHWYDIKFDSLSESKALVARSCPTLYNPTDCSRQASLFMGFSRQEYWSG